MCIFFLFVAYQHIKQHTATPQRKGDWPKSYSLLSLSAAFTAKGMIVSFFQAPSQIMFLWPSPAKQENLLFAFEHTFIFYCDPVLKTLTLLSLGFICTFLKDYCKVRWFSPHALSCAFWHSSWWSACIALLDLLMLYYLKPPVSPNSQCFIIFRVCTLSAPHKPHFRLRRAFLSFVHKTSPKLAGKLAWRGQCRYSDIFTDARCLFTVTQCSFSFSSSLPWPEKSAKGDRQLFSGIWQSKNPSWLTVVHFTLCMSTHRRGKVSKKSDGGCQCQQNSLLWCSVSKRWAEVLLWTWRDVCYLGDGECVWLDLCCFSVHILTSLI